MLRLYDWLCAQCGARTESLVDVPYGESPPDGKELVCKDHGLTPHNRTISLPAPYTGEHVRNPHVYGGQFDTLGFRPVQSLPDLPGAEQHSQETARKLASIPENAPMEERYSVLREAGKTAPSEADYASLFRTSEYKDAEKKRVHEQRLNAKKRQRKAALDTGASVNFRRDKCEGDPVI